ncbi:DUF1801 domain-containing protein [Flavitalea sp.]|nr:DUF1801 domain-containing protein [Flavitalea sp.]
MATTKTKASENNVTDFIKSWAEEKRQEDSFKLIELMQAASGHEPKMWGPTIVGFGSYHYKYDSGHEGDAPLLGFSPRKAAISLYVYTGREDHKYLLEGLGKFKIGKVCIYINKLSDIDEKKLKLLMKESLKYMKANYKTN